MSGAARPTPFEESDFEREFPARRTSTWYPALRMTSKEKAIVQALIAVAWADGAVGGPEEGVVEGLLAGFDASDEEEAELLAWAKSPRTLGDVNITTLEQDDRELLLSNAALLVSADGTETNEERAVLDKLAGVLHLDADEAREIVRSTRGRAPTSKR